MDKDLGHWENQIDQIEIPYQKIDDIIHFAIVKGRDTRKKKNRWKMISYIASAAVLMLGLTISSAYISPAMASVLEKVPVLGTIINKMSDAIFNFETLEATYVEKEHGKNIAEIYAAFDYKNNRAYGITKDAMGHKQTESLIKNGKRLEYNHISKRYREEEQPVNERKKSSRPPQPGFVRLHSNPLNINIGGATIAITDPQQYAEGLLQWAKPVIQGESKFLGRRVDVVEVYLPDEGDLRQIADKIEFYVDKQTGIILKMTEFLHEQPVRELYATMVKVNEPIKDSVFYLEVPKDGLRHKNSDA